MSRPSRKADTQRPQRDTATGYVYVESRKANTERAHRELVSEHSRYLTPGEVRHARLRLSQQMVDLVLSEGDALPAPMQATLQGLTRTLGQVLKQTRCLS
jgi:hypothetical protein